MVNMKQAKQFIQGSAAEHTPTVTKYRMSEVMSSYVEEPCGCRRNGNEATLCLNCSKIYATVTSSKVFSFIKPGSVKTDFSDVVGLEDAKEIMLRDVILPFSGRGCK